MRGSLVNTQYRGALKGARKHTITEGQHLMVWNMISVADNLSMKQSRMGFLSSVTCGAQRENYSAPFHRLRAPEIKS